MFCRLTSGLFMIIVAVYNVATFIMLYNTIVEGITQLIYSC